MPYLHGTSLSEKNVRAELQGSNPVQGHHWHLDKDKSLLKKRVTFFFQISEIKARAYPLTYQRLCCIIYISHKLMTDINKKGGYILSISIKDKQKLGKQIKKQRERNGISQRSLAIECDITPQSLCDIEKGINFPSVDVFMKLVEVADFEDKEKIYNLYGELKETAPPDVVKYLLGKTEIITELRQKIKQEKGEL